VSVVGIPRERRRGRSVAEQASERASEAEKRSERERRGEGERRGERQREEERERELRSERENDTTCALDVPLCAKRK